MRHRLVPPLSALLALALATSTAAAQPAQPAPKAEEPPPEGARGPTGASGTILKPAEQPKDEPPQGKTTMPRPLNYTPPEYPPAAQKEGLEAKVTLQLDIDKQGKVLNVVVIEPAGHGFDEAAVAAAKKLDFEPARRPDGSPFGARILYRYSFTLKTAEPTPEETKGPTTAQAAPSFSGRVVSADGEAPITGASVVITGADGAGRTEHSGSDGGFAFADLAPGALRVQIYAPGFDPLNIDETLAPGEALEVKYRLATKGGPLEVTIRGEKPPREVTKRTLEQREISRIPGTNGDALRSIQSLPGVARPPGIAGLLIVRGSAPQDTQTFVDGTPVPLIYHFGGLSSVVPTELLDKIDFYPGNFSTQYGRVQGGIVDAGMRAPKDDGKYHGLAQADLIDARFLFEGPIPLLKGWTFAVAARRSYVDTWLGPVLKSAGAGVTQAPVYYDYQLMVQKEISSDSNIRLAFFGSDDALQLLLDKPSPGEPALAGNVGLHTAFQRLQLKYTNALGPSTKLNVVAALGRDVVEFGLSSFFFTLDYKSITGRVELSQKLFKGATFHTGLDLFSGAYSVNFRGPAAPAPGEPANQPFSTRAVFNQKLDGFAALPGIYGEMELEPLAHLRLVPGVRVDNTGYTGQWEVSPRFNGRYDLKAGYPRSTVKAGLGVFHQPPAFQEATPPLGTPGVNANRAIQYALGFEQDLNHQVEGSVEGFYKQLDNQVIGAPSPSGASLVYTNMGRGNVVGAEVLIKYKPDAHFFGWLAYTLSRSARTDAPGQPEHLVSYDQTHILTVLGSYRLGNGWEFGARFRLVSGNLVTPDVCDSSASGCDPNRTAALFHAPSGVYTPIPFSGPASERLPFFHQLDLRLDKRWKFKSWELSAYLDVQNVYNHGNVEGLSYNFNYTARSYVTGVPILPSIGLRGEL